VGSDQRTALPAGALLGAAICIGADAIARVAIPLAQIAVGAHPTSVELPVGVVTALFGAPFFIVLLVRRQSRGESV
ncbi:MAG: iron chelate uptake ABC transporter family permease subunit, partial [Gemmataceae bacterium]